MKSAPPTPYELRFAKPRPPTSANSTPTHITFPARSIQLDRVAKVIGVRRVLHSLDVLIAE